MVWILLVDFDLSLLTKIPYVKHINCENSRSASKEASILLLSWNNLSIISSKWPISWILFDWPLIVTTFKSTSKTHLLWKFQVLWQRRVSISIYLTKFSFLQVCKMERTETAMGKNCVKPENFRKVTGKHLCRSLVFNKVACLHFETFENRDSRRGAFPWISKILRSSHPEVFCKEKCS